MKESGAEDMVGRKKAAGQMKKGEMAAV